MTFANVVAPRISATPEGDSGDYNRVTFVAGSGAQAESSCQKVYEDTTVLLGNHIFISCFVRAQGVATYVPLHYGTYLANNANDYFVKDENLYFTLAVNITENGILSEESQSGTLNDSVSLFVQSASTGNIAGMGWKQIYFNFSSTENGALRRVNLDTSRWLWVCLYLDTLTESNSRLYINGATFIPQYVATNAAEYTAPDGDTDFSAQNLYRIDDSEPLDTVDIAHDWFGSAVDGSVIGQPDFIKEFVNTDGTAKNLGDGTVQGVTPHWYFSTAVDTEYNDATGETWENIFKDTETTYEAQDGVVDWYSPPDVAAVQLSYTGTNNTARPNHYLFDNAHERPNQLVFFSIFVKGASSSQSRNFALILYGLSSGANHLNLTLYNYYNSTNTVTFANYLTSNSSTQRRLVAPASAINNQWFHLCGYVDTIGGDSWIRIDGLAANISSATNTATQTTVTGAPKYFNESGASTAGLPAVRFAHLVWYEQDVIEANTGVNWADSTLWSNFVDNGKPADIGIYGENAIPGVNPSGYINTSLRLGLNGIAKGGTEIVALKQQYDSNNGNTYILDNTPILDENIQTPAILRT